MRRFAWVFIVIAAACGRKTETAPEPAATPAAPTGVAPTPLPTPVTAPVADMPAGTSPNERCEVEIAGRFEGLTAPKDHDYIVYVSDGDCLDPKAHILQRAICSAEGGFFAEVFVPCGTDLTACGSIEPQAMDSAPKPTTRFGKLDKTLHAVGVGEIEFTDLRIVLAAGPERSFPAPKP